ncbi:hypothetical protein KEM48_007680 [Puccinia striiformis f. sp. tritici PST-130]|nr:hypothetical protein KEM48_007680 [Puccinia striiformis f. sp. tritici PST-130]
MPTLRPRSNPISYANNGAGGQPAKKEKEPMPSDGLKVPNLKAALEHHNIPFSNNLRRPGLAKLYDKLMTSLPGRARPEAASEPAPPITTKRKHSFENARSNHLLISDQELKRALKQLNISHRPHARRATLLKLYNQHLAKEKNSRVDTNQNEEDDHACKRRCRDLQTDSRIPLLVPPSTSPKAIDSCTKNISLPTDPPANPIPDRSPNLSAKEPLTCPKEAQQAEASPLNQSILKEELVRKGHEAPTTSGLPSKRRRRNRCGSPNSNHQPIRRRRKPRRDPDQDELQEYNFVAQLSKPLRRPEKRPATPSHFSVDPHCPHEPSTSNPHNEHKESSNSFQATPQRTPTSPLIDQPVPQPSKILIDSQSNSSQSITTRSQPQCTSLSGTPGLIDSPSQSQVIYKLISPDLSDAQFHLPNGQQSIVPTRDGKGKQRAQFECPGILADNRVDYEGNDDSTAIRRLNRSVTNSKKRDPPHKKQKHRKASTNILTQSQRQLRKLESKKARQINKKSKKIKKNPSLDHISPLSQDEAQPVELPSASLFPHASSPEIHDAQIQTGLNEPNSDVDDEAPIFRICRKKSTLPIIHDSDDEDCAAPESLKKVKPPPTPSDFSAHLLEPQTHLPHKEHEESSNNFQASPQRTPTSPLIDQPLSQPINQPLSQPINLPIDTDPNSHHAISTCLQPQETSLSGTPSLIDSQSPSQVIQPSTSPDLSNGQSQSQVVDQSQPPKTNSPINTGTTDSPSNVQQSSYQIISTPDRKRKEMSQSKWPRPPQLNTHQIKGILVENRVDFDANSDRTAIAQLYRTFIESTKQDLPHKKHKHQKDLANNPATSQRRLQKPKSKKVTINTTSIDQTSFFPSLELIPPLSQDLTQSVEFSVPSLLPHPNSTEINDAQILTSSSEPNSDIDEAPISRTRQSKSSLLIIPDSDDEYEEIAPPDIQGRRLDSLNAPTPINNCLVNLVSTSQGHIPSMSPPQEQQATSTLPQGQTPTSPAPQIHDTESISPTEKLLDISNIPALTCDSHVKRRSEDTPDQLPLSDGLTVLEMRNFLDKFDVAYKKRDKKARITALYNSLRTRQSRLFRKKYKRQRLGLTSKTRVIESSSSEGDRCPTTPQRRRHRTRSSNKGKEVLKDAGNSYNFTFHPSTIPVRQPTDHRPPSTGPTVSQSYPAQVTLSPSQPVFISSSSSPHPINPAQSTIQRNSTPQVAPSTPPLPLHPAQNHISPHPIPMSPNSHHSHQSFNLQTDDPLIAENEENLHNTEPNVTNWRSSVHHDGTSGHDANFSCGASHDSEFRLLTSYAAQSVKVSRKIYYRLGQVVENLEDLKERTSAGASHLATTSQPAAPTSKTQNVVKTPQGGRINRLIRIHVSTLLGDHGALLPHPPGDGNEQDLPETEEARNPRSDLDDEAGSRESSDNESRNSLESGTRVGHSTGPSHPAASEETLEIMGRMIREAGIESFQPDFTQTCSSPDNNYLWDLAVQIFVELVVSGEYSGINLETFTPVEIRAAIERHVTQRLQRRYRQENKWTVERKAAHSKRLRCTSRLYNLRNARVNFLESVPGMGSLAPIVKACTSDDDTDDEYQQAIQVSYRKGEPKRCITRQVPWRHPRIARLMIDIDTLRARAMESTPKGPSGAAARIRRRDTALQLPSQIKAPSNIPKGCFNSSWLESLPPHRKIALKMRSTAVKPGITRVKDLVSRV